MYLGLLNITFYVLVLKFFLLNFGLIVYIGCFSL